MSFGNEIHREYPHTKTQTCPKTTCRRQAPIPQVGKAFDKTDSATTAKRSEAARKGSGTPFPERESMLLAPPPHLPQTNVGGEVKKGNPLSHKTTYNNSKKAFFFWV